ncbi:AAA family ATPase [Vibrio parahaemolyticus]|uniref:AAA family ATPase n=1 Tax=Vibrio parahaemolyticus TaxID=670 RepID=UPI00235FB199|nr:AAA family ATPase [Vibrio parahaemolyticus]EIO4083680.1 AAA family ATPase [Vibrio parahaemolyticus]EJC1449779.1 AAA family ATPase [Vibrio parahaemolyticus]MDF4613388.1 AAA family ATPase [Vibrio parahaemolyticus]
MEQIKLTHLRLENYKGFKELDLQFNKQLNLFVGVNGSGKSSVLEAIKLSLSWLVNRIQREKANGLQVQKSDIHKGTLNASISLTASAIADGNDENFQWKLTQSTETTKEEASYKEATELARKIWQHHKQHTQLPIIEVYPISRVVETVSPDASKEEVSVLDVYENALTGKANYQSFFEWFRYQDDILNERLLTQSVSKSYVNSLLTLLSKLKQLALKSDIESAHMFSIIRDIIEGNSQSDVVNIKSSINVLLRFVESDDAADKKVISTIQKLAKKYKYKSSSNITTLEVGVKELIERISSSKQKTHQDYYVSLFSIILFMYSLDCEDRFKLKIINKINNLRLSNLVENTTSIVEIMKGEEQSQGQILRNKGKELEVVRKAIESFIPEYKDLQVKREPEARMEVLKSGELFNLNQLSDGEKNLIALIGDIARRLTMANPNLDNPLDGEGIILIDEVDMHLHPKWQRVLAENLTSVFKNCQFFLSTHSPQVISHIKKESIIGLENVGKEIRHFTVNDSYGKNTDRILEDIMQASSRPSMVQDKLDKIFSLISNKDLDKARSEIIKLKSSIGEDSELVKASTLIKRKELINR